MPFTFSAGSFSFLKSSTFSSSQQSSIKQNNNVDNVNNNNNNNSDNLDTGNNCFPQSNLYVIPLERRVRSLDNSSTKNDRRDSSASSNLKNNNRKVWYKLLFGRLHQTLSRWNDNNDDEQVNSENNVHINHDDHKDDGENSNVRVVKTDGSTDDDVLMMKPTGNRKCAFVRHGNTHDFYITKNETNDIIKPSTEGTLKKDPSSSSIFEKCAQTPRHFTKETEVLGKVGRFTIVREREDFDTTYFDQCHCQQKPCRFPTNGCGTHPVLPPELLPEFNDVVLPSSKSSRSLYSNSTPSNNSSRHSLSSLQKLNNNCINTVPKPIAPSSSSSCRGVLPQSSSSPNLVHLNQRSRNETLQSKSTPTKNNNNNNNRSSMSIIISGNGKHSNFATINNGHHYPQCTTNISMMKKAKKSSIINIKATEEEQRRLSMPPPTPPTPTYLSTPSSPTTPSKHFHSIHNQSNEPLTINSHSGRKFEVEWNCTAKSSSSSSTSSSSSSETAYSPPSTSTSVLSMASSPEKSMKSSTTNSTLSRRCSTLSSKCGRKFEVTVLSSSSGSNSCLTISPHSTINSNHSTIVETIDVNTESAKC